MRNVAVWKLEVVVCGGSRRTLEADSQASMTQHSGPRRKRDEVDRELGYGMGGAL